MLWLLPVEGPTLAAETELMLGAGSGPGTGVCVDPAATLPEPTALEIEALLPTELTKVDDTLAVDDRALVDELDDADEIAGH